MEEINIEDYLNSKFKDFEVEPLHGSFNTVMEKVAVGKEKKRRAGFFYVLSGAAALLLIYFTVVVSEKLNYKTESSIANKESSKASGITTQNTIHKGPVNFPIKNKTVPIESMQSSTLKNLAGKNEVQQELPASKETNQPITGKNQKEPEQPVAATYPDQKQVDTEQIQRDPQQTFVHEPENNSVLPTTTSQFETTSKLNADVLEGITFGMLPEANEILAVSSFDTKAGRDLRRLQSSRFKARFFAGISCQAVMMEQTYALNSSGNTDPIRYPADFKSSYIEGRRKESSRSTVTMPGILFGVSMRRFELRATIGAFQVRDYEIVSYPEDSLNTGSANTATPFGLWGGGGSGPNSARSVAPSSQLSQGEQCGNIFNYVYGSLGVNAIFHFYNFRIKPGVAMAYNRSLMSTYALVDENGYGKYKNSTKHLNKDVYSLSFQCALSKRLSRFIELQVSPVYIVSLSSVFDEKYFLSQKFNGFGLEGALIYKFPVKLGK